MSVEIQFNSTIIGNRWVVKSDFLKENRSEEQEEGVREYSFFTYLFLTVVSFGHWTRTVTFDGVVHRVSRKS